jgi:hypothetical protein
MSDTHEDPLYLNVPAMLGNEAGKLGIGLAMDLITIIWWPLKAPFSWEDDGAIADTLNSAVPARGYTAESVREVATAAKTYFTQLADRRWAPSPEYFSLTNGNPGSQS